MLEQMKNYTMIHFLLPLDFVTRLLEVYSNEHEIEARETSPFHSFTYNNHIVQDEETNNTPHVLLPHNFKHNMIDM